MTTSRDGATFTARQRICRRQPVCFTRASERFDSSCSPSLRFRRDFDPWLRARSRAGIVGPRRLAVVPEPLGRRRSRSLLDVDRRLFLNHRWRISVVRRRVVPPPIWIWTPDPPWIGDEHRGMTVVVKVVMAAVPVPAGRTAAPVTTAVRGSGTAGCAAGHVWGHRDKRDGGARKRDREPLPH